MSTQTEFGLREIFAVLKRRWWIVAITVAVVTGLSAILLSTATPRYTAEAVLMIEPQEVQLPDLYSAVRGVGQDAQAVQGEMEVLKSRAVAARVIDRLRLDRDPEYGLTAPRPRNTGSASEDWRVDGLAHLAPVERTIVTDEFAERLEVTPRGESRVISVRYTDHDAEQAAQIANTVVETYLQNQLDSKLLTTRRTNEWLEDRIASLQGAVREAEQKVAAYRAETGLIETADTSRDEADLQGLSSQLLGAQDARNEAQAKLRQARALLRSGSAEAIASAPQVLDSSVIQRLKEQEAQLRRELADLTQVYGDRHPRMLGLRAEEQALSQKIDAETGRIIDNLSNQVSIAASRVADLEAQIRDAETRVFGAKTDSIQLRELERDLNSNRQLLENMMARYQEVRVQDSSDMISPDARVVSWAFLPDEASFPKVVPMVLLAFIGSLLLGGMLAFVRESFDHAVRDADRAEAVTGRRALSQIPNIANLPAAQTPSAYLLANPGSSFAEAVRAGYWNADIAAGESKVWLITSAREAEGKTSLATSIARAKSRSGKKVLLVDMNWFQPAVCAELGIRATRSGISEFLRLDASLSEVLRLDRESGLHVLCAGAPVHDPAALFSSPRLQRFLEYARTRYDCVILDAAALFEGPEALVLAQRVDATMLVVDAGSDQADVVSALQRLDDAQANTVGVLLNRVGRSSVNRRLKGVLEGAQSLRVRRISRTADAAETPPAQARVNADTPKLSAA